MKLPLSFPIRLGWLLLLALACNLPLPALERIETHDGRVIDGEILRREHSGTPQETLTIQTGPVQVTLRADQISTITVGTPEDAVIAQGREALNTGEAERAIQLFDQALSMSMQPERQANALAEVLLRQGDALAATLPVLNDERTTALQRIVLTAARAHGLPPDRASELISRRLQFDILLGNDDDTSRVLAWLGPSYFAHYTAERDRLTKWVLDALPMLQQAAQRDDAVGMRSRVLDALKLLRRVNPELAGSQHTQLILEWAWQERQAKRWDAALQLYVHYILDEAPEIARDRIQLTLQDAEQAYRETDNLPAAAALYEQYGLPSVPKLARERLLVIWHDQGWRALRQRDFDAARTSFERADALQPGTATLDFAQLDYQRRKQGVPTTDTLQRYQLAMFCLEQKLLPEAVAELRLARANPLIRENADAHIGNIQNQQAEAELLRLMKLYEAGEYGKVLGGLNAFMQQEYAPGYLKQARQLQDLTNDALKLRIAERPQQAEGLFQRAQRAYYDGHYAEAEELLRAVIDRYGDTVAQTRARNFYAAVRQKLELARLEQGRDRQPATASAVTRTTDTLTTLSRATDELDRLRRNLERMNY
jgi:hypothetical protein